jgi:geranylgeranyl diphosphate synthase, type III
MKRLDDIEDSSHLREGKNSFLTSKENHVWNLFFFIFFPGAYRLFGIPQTINSANYSYFDALLELNKLNSTELNGIVLQELLSLHEGQGLDIL